MKKIICESSEDIIVFANKVLHLRRHAITNGSKKTVEIIGNYLNLRILKIPSNTKCWDWIIPKKWEIKKAIIKKDNNVILDKNDHIMAIQPYSSSFNGKISYEELIKHIVYNKKMPNEYAYNCKLAYRYPYEKNWLVSLPYNKVKNLNKGIYNVEIDAKFSNGEMLIGEYTIKGKSNKTIILLSDICHPGQADDGIIGVGLWIRILQKLSKNKKLNYTYKFYTPTETIGSIAWLWKRKNIIPNIKCGIFLESIGNKKPLKVNSFLYVKVLSLNVHLD